MSVYYAQQNREKVLMSDPVYGVFPSDIVITKLTLFMDNKTSLLGGPSGLR